MPFLVRLVAFCRTLLPDVGDVELAQAVGLAWERKKLTQRGEGLFLYTVPEVLLELRRRPPPSPAVQSRDLEAGIKLLIRQVRERLNRWKPDGLSVFAAVLTDLEAVADNFDAGHIDIQTVDRQMEHIEAEIVEVTRGLLSAEERAAIGRAVEELLAPYAAPTRRRQPMRAEQLDALRGQFSAREILAHFSIPRLSMLYA